MPVILAAVFFIALSGYYLGYGLYIRRNTSFFPVLFITYTVLVLYIFGLAGFLQAGFYAIIAAGIALHVLALIKKKNEILPLIKKTLTDPSLLFMAAGTVWIWFITKGTGVSHGDDFSHWYKICKMMYFENAYPTMPDMLFPSYAPGTATWIWFITSITGFAPDKCFFANSLINLAALNTFFALGGRKADKGNTVTAKIMLFIFVSAVSVFLCSMDVNTYCLLTDTTIALIPVAAVLFVLSEDAEHSRTGTVMFTALMCFEALIKIAGLPFILFAVIFRNMHIKKELPSSKLSYAAVKILPAVIPFAVFYAYIIRAKIVFGSLENSGQGLSIARYLSMFSQKSGDQVRGIFVRFLQEMFDLTGVMSMQVRLLWLIFAVLLVVFLIARKKINAEQKEFFKTSLELSVFFVVYSLFLLLTYLFSMNNKEANSDLLNCFYRYIGSVTIFVSGIIVYYLYGLFTDMDKRKSIIAAAALCAVPLAVSIFMFDIGYIAGFSHCHQTEVFTTASWDLLCEYAPEKYYYNEESYFIIYREEDVKDCLPVKTRVAAAAYLRTNNVYALSTDDLRSGTLSNENRSLLGSCDYLVTLGDLSGDLDIIREYVDITDYRPGTISLKHG